MQTLLQPNKSPANLTGELWCVTCYYNWCGYNNKLRCFKQFYESLRSQNVRILVVELGQDESLLQVRGVVKSPDIYIQIIDKEAGWLWQKERLLNIGISKLPQSCDKVVWLDADVLFYDNAWATKTSKLLNEYVVVQPFNRCIKSNKKDYIPDGSKGYPISTAIVPEYPTVSLGFIGAYMRWLEKSLFAINNNPQWGSPGYGCAFRRSLLQKHKLYEYRPDGDSDTYIKHAVLGAYNSLVRWDASALSQSYRKWATRFADDINYSINFLQSDVCHLYHGVTQKRQYKDRSQWVTKYHFDPYKHLVDNKNQLLQWSDLAPIELRTAMARHYYERDEDK